MKNFDLPIEFKLNSKFLKSIIRNLALKSKFLISIYANSAIEFFEIRIWKIYLVQMVIIHSTIRLECINWWILPKDRYPNYNNKWQNNSSYQDHRLFSSQKKIKTCILFWFDSSFDGVFFVSYMGLFIYVFLFSSWPLRASQLHIHLI